MSRFMFIFVKEHSTTIRFPSMFPCVPSIVCLVYQLIFCMDYFGLHFPEFINLELQYLRGNDTVHHCEGYVPAKVVEGLEG